MDEQKGKGHEECQVERTIAHLRMNGIVVTPPDEQGVVTIVQEEANNGRIRTNKELHQLARRLYPDKCYKIRPITFSLSLDIVTPEWIRERMKVLNIHTKDLVQQLGITPSEISVFVNGKRPMSRAMRAMFYYYFLTFELNARAHFGVLSQDLDIVGERKMAEQRIEL